MSWVIFAEVCPKNCSGHGTCNTTTGECECYTGFTGVSCSQSKIVC